MAGIAEDTMFEGMLRTIKYALCTNGKKPAKEFIESLSRKKQIQLIVLLERMATAGKISNPQKFSHLREKIYEFKSGQIRILCFQEGIAWVLTHGFIKKQNKTPRREIDKAEAIMYEYLGKNG